MFKNTRRRGRSRFAFTLHRHAPIVTGIPMDTVTAAKTDGRPCGSPSVPGHTLLSKIGEGAYGDVYLARHASGAFRAVKIVYRDRVSDADAFEREYRGVSAFRRVPRTRGLVRIFAVGRDDAAGMFFTVMEAADDERRGRRIDPETYRPATLAGLLSAHVALPLKDCAGLAAVLADALRHLQEHHLAHRDIKPGNVLYVRGRPVLADVGLVADMRDIRSVVGTPGYAPPENHGTPQGDVYSLGRLLYAASTGRGAGEAGFAPREEADTGSPFFANWLAILRKACAERPADRYGSAKAMQADLLALRRRMRWRGRKGCLLWAGGSLALCLVLLFTVVLKWVPPDVPPRQEGGMTFAGDPLASIQDSPEEEGRLHINPVLLTEPPDAQELFALPTLLKTAPFPVPETDSPFEFTITSENITREALDFMGSTNRLETGTGYLDREKRRPLGTGDYPAWFDRWGYLEGGHYTREWDPKADKPLALKGLWEISGTAGSLPKDLAGMNLRLTDKGYAILSNGKEIETGTLSTSEARSAATFTPDKTKLKLAFFCWEEGGGLTLQGYSCRLSLRRLSP